MDISAWLRELGLERYEAAFRDNEIDDAILTALTAEDLSDLGVTVVGHRRKLLNAIAALEHDAPPVASPAVDAMAGAEQRQVTVLFADLAGYTKLTRELDAEEVHALLGRFFELVDGLVTQYGGTVDKHIGDCVMAVFGAPTAHGNDPERAVRAALQIQGQLPILSAELGRPVGVHIGIASGQVVASATGSSDHREYTVTGDSVNLASRLTDAAKTGEILISDAIQRALSQRLECDEVEPLAVKGVAAPVRAWRLRGWRQIAGARQACVGRRAELHQFEGALRACLETRCGQAVYVRGEAGIGKTRLVEEFQSMAEANGFACHTSQVLDFGTGTGRDAIRLLVRGLVGLAPDAHSEDVRAAAEQALGEGLVEADQHVFLNDLLDLPQPPALRALYDGMDNPSRHRGKSRAVAGLVARMARRNPLMLVVEDIHWADGLTLQHLARVTATVADCPALLVMSSRIEGDPLDQAWRSEIGSSPLTTVDIGPLRRQDAESLANAYIHRNLALVQQCVERAAGNPLFLEQLLRYAEDSRPAGIPGSVQNLIQARMDQLRPPDKVALQAACIFGQRFSLEALRFLIDQPDYSCAELVAHFLIRPRAEDFLFAHALIRDGVYDSLLKSRRRELHRRAADWFAGRDVVLRAEHLDRAEAPEAPRAYLDAARAQADEHRFERARQLVERGLALAQEPAELFALMCFKGDVLHNLGSMQEAKHAYEKALQQAPEEREQCHAWLGLAAVKRMIDDIDGAFIDLDRAEASAAKLDLIAERARIHLLRGNLYFPKGEIERCLAEHRQGLEFARQAGSTELEAAALGGLGDAEYVRGRMISAYERFDRCVAVCREHGFAWIEVSNLAMRGISRFYRADVRGALGDALAAAEAARKLGHHRGEMIARIIAAELLANLVELTPARQELERVDALVQQLGARRFEALRLNCLAKVRRAEGRREEALSLVERSVAIGRETGLSFSGPASLGALALTTDDPEARDDALSEGEALLQAGCVAHNHFRFCRDAIDATLNVGEWDRAEHFAAVLEDFTRPEPLGWTQFYIARARALATHGRGHRDAVLMAEIERLAADACRTGLRLALPALEGVRAAGHG